MQLTIVIDGGTTNMRAMLINEQKECLGIVTRKVGLRNAATRGSNAILIESAAVCLQELYEQTGILETDVDKILVCGGLSTELGIHNVEYTPLPADKYDLNRTMKSVVIPEISKIPLLFLSGVMNRGHSIDDIAVTDAMKSEEAEAIAAYSALGSGDYIFVFPGSHTKVALMNQTGKILRILGCLTGELLAAISQHTLIADSVGAQFLSENELVESAFLLGCDMAKKYGLNRAVFSTRMLNRFYCKDYLVTRSFLLGAVLQGDIQAIENSGIRNGYETAPIYVVGAGPMQNAFKRLLIHANLGTEIRTFTSEKNIPLTGIGSCIIADAVRERA